MSTKRKIEVFSAGCPACEETISLINQIACPSCEIEVLDMQRKDVAAKARQYGIRSVPAVVINGKLADCCSGATFKSRSFDPVGLEFRLREAQHEGRSAALRVGEGVTPVLGSTSEAAISGTVRLPM